MKRFPVIALLFLVLPLGAYAEPSPGSVRTIIGSNGDLKDGEMALRAGDYKTAIDKLLSGLTETPSRHDKTMALNNLCAAYSLAGEYDVSLDYCDQALKLNPRAWRAYQNRARSLIGKGEIEGAIQSAQQGLEIVPESPSLKKTLAIAQRLNANPHVIIDTFDAGSNKP